MDGRNRRVARRVYDDQDTLQDERRWLWQGQLRIVAELDGDGELVKRFVYGTKVNVPEYMVTYDPVSHLETGTYRILTDQLGSLRLVVDVSAGTVVQRMRHDEWGNVLENVGSGITPFGFAGGLYDPATGLVRFGARDYDPETGRWTGKDPIGFTGGSSNLYRYLDGCPVNSTDPRGLEDDGTLKPKLKLMENWDLELMGSKSGPLAKPPADLKLPEETPPVPQPSGAPPAKKNPKPLNLPAPAPVPDLCSPQDFERYEALERATGQPNPCKPIAPKIPRPKECDGPRTQKHGPRRQQ